MDKSIDAARETLLPAALQMDATLKQGIIDAEAVKQAQGELLSSATRDASDAARAQQGLPPRGFGPAGTVPSGPYAGLVVNGPAFAGAAGVAAQVPQQQLALPPQRLALPPPRNRAGPSAAQLQAEAQLAALQAQQ